jgi:hypothetical protein
MSSGSRATWSGAIALKRSAHLRACVFSNARCQRLSSLARMCCSFTSHPFRVRVSGRVPRACSLRLRLLADGAAGVAATQVERWACVQRPRNTEARVDTSMSRWD